MELSAVSLFAGIGGICLGFQQAGFKIIWANEIDHAACLTYRHNLGSNYLVEGDIRQISEQTVPHSDVLAAGFPCQSFSTAGAGRGFQDSRGILFFEVVRIISATQPRAIFLENVENLIEHDNGRTFQTIYASLVELGYIIHYRAMPTHKYANIPQTRRRVYIVAFRSIANSCQFQFPDEVPLTAKAMDWIEHDKKQPDIYYYDNESSFDHYVCNAVTDESCFYRIFNGSITKLQNRKCPTLTASMNTPRNAAVLRDRFGVRRITLREALRFQGFPVNYYFPKAINIQQAYHQIGNSVTVPVIQRIAEKIKIALVGSD